MAAAARVLTACLLSAGESLAAFSPPAQLTVVTDVNYPPYLFLTQGGQQQGILVDKWALWSQRTGVPVRVEGMEWAKAQESVQNGTQDVLEALAYTEGRTRSYEYSPPYGPVEARVYFHRTISGINDAASMRGFAIGAKHGSACAIWLSERGIDTIFGYSTSEDLVKAAGAGEVRLFCMDSPAAQYFLFKHGLDREFRQTAPLYTTHFHWAVRKGQTELRDFIQQGFERITPREREEIDARWIGNPLKFPFSSQYLYYLAFALAAVLGPVALLVLWNRTLRSRVAAKTAEHGHALESLQKHADRVQDLYNNAPCGYHSLDTDGVFVQINDTELGWLGYRREELVGKRRLVEFIAEADRAAFAENFAVFRQRGFLSDIEYELERRDGSRMSVLLSATLLRDPGGNYLMSRATLHDISERKRAEDEVLRLNAELEKRIADRTAQLTLANKELRAVNEQLESFSYSVSHDLRAPLRHIDGFAKMLREHAQNLDPKSLEFLDTISKSAKWMGRLIDDLLTLARTTRQEFHSAQIDLDALVSSAREQCLPDVRDRKLEWKIGPLPTVQGDGTLLRAVFVNLLSNAIKFTGRRELAVIEVGALPGDGGEAIIYVKDNGAGFDMRYAKRLFGVFQRMHGQREFEGTGVGLATVQRIITRHGGRVWVDAEPDRGATFYVALRQTAQVSTKAA